MPTAHLIGLLLLLAWLLLFLLKVLRPLWQLFSQRVLFNLRLRSHSKNNTPSKQRRTRRESR